VIDIYIFRPIVRFYIGVSLNVIQCTYDKNALDYIHNYLAFPVF
jgi:hypothetical protein